MEFFTILYRILEPFRKEFYIYCLKIVLYQTLDLIDAYILSLVISLIAGENPQKSLIILMVGILAFDELFNRYDNYLDWIIITKFLHRIYHFLKQTALAKLLIMDAKWHHQNHSGTLIGEIQNGTQVITDMVAGLTWEFVPTLIQTVLSATTLAYFNWQIALACFGSLTIYWLVTLWQHKKQHPIREQRHSRRRDEWKLAQEAVQAVGTIATYGQEGTTLERYEQIHEEMKALGREEAHIGIYKGGRWRIRVINLSRRLILITLAFQVVQKDLALSQLVFLITLIEKFLHSFWRISRLHDRAAESLKSAQRLGKIPDLKPEVVSPANPIPIETDRVQIRFDNVSLSYNGDGDYAVHRLKFTIEPGEVIGIAGTSGAGKTTLARLINRMYDPTEGRVLINGVDARKVDLKVIRSLSATVPQGSEVDILDAGFDDNIRLSNPDASQDEIEKAAKRAGIYSFVISQPLRFKTHLGERGLKLSGGQRQRVALARAFLADRPVLIMDEAVSSIDAITAAEIQENIRDLCKDGRTVIIIAHDLSTIQRIANRILVIEGGRLVEEGSHEELLALGGQYAKLCHAQQ